jgi:pantoate--beta-alanine ligase
MKILETVHDMKLYRQKMTSTVGFIPTMGALHRGHLSLIAKAKQECDGIITSIFVNPTQFNDPKDLAKYPRPLERDLTMARQAGVDVVFLPTAKEMYVDEYRFQMRENQLSKMLCGAHRPGHFEGVLTVVMKLLMITTPDRAYFGEKDYQQFLLIREMAQAFFLPTEIIGLPTVREASGLAMSSRNVRLSKQQRTVAPMLFHELKSGKTPLEIKHNLESAGFTIEYLEEHFGRRFAAVFLGDVRLIDNV